MKLLYRGEVQTECRVMDALHGHSCDAIVLDAHDVRRIEKLMANPVMVAIFKDWWSITLSCRFG